jgi:ankyrin repeat protein
MTALMLASKNGNYKIVKLLTDNGANCNISDGPYGTTPLILASMKGHKDVVTLLLGKNADFDFKNKWDITALIWASANGYTEVVKVLLEKGANPASKLKGETAYDLAKNDETKALIANYMNK